MDDLTPEDLEAGRRLFAAPCKFTAGAATEARLPPTSLPEVAFIGRSNVGKSSLINALTGRNALARASVTPGRTQQINFFNLGERLILADLPGYGFAKAPRSVVDAWMTLVSSYLRYRETLQRTCLLNDARHGIKDSDTTMLSLLDQAGIATLVVLTKVDKVNEMQTTTTRQDILVHLKSHPAAAPLVLATSATTGEGIAELRARLAGLAKV
ncbi:MAG: ribosome biogenesis GTP-binding protein YihA/YsxC [Alphaproteobacteria bacterium]